MSSFDKDQFHIGQRVEGVSSQRSECTESLLGKHGTIVGFAREDSIHQMTGCPWLVMVDGSKPCEKCGIIHPSMFAPDHMRPLDEPDADMSQIKPWQDVAINHKPDPLMTLLGLLMRAKNEGGATMGDVEIVPLGKLAGSAKEATPAPTQTPATVGDRNEKAEWDAITKMLGGFDPRNPGGKAVH